MRVEWNQNGFAQLAEREPTTAEDKYQLIEIARRQRDIDRVSYDLTIHRGEDDITFYDLSGADVCQLAEDLIGLVGGMLRVCPPAEPEIKF